MALAETTIKRHNHKLHICQEGQKQGLLSHILDLYPNQTILLLSDTNTTTTEVKDKQLTLSNDVELEKFPEQKWDVVISYEVPTDSDAYLERMNRANQFVILLAYESEEKLLYPLEIALGRSILREPITPFAPIVIPKKEYPKKIEGHERSPFGAKKSFSNDKPRHTSNNSKRPPRILKMPAPK